MKVRKKFTICRKKSIFTMLNHKNKWIKVIKKFGVNSMSIFIFTSHNVSSKCCLILKILSHYICVDIHFANKHIIYIFYKYYDKHLNKILCNL